MTDIRKKEKLNQAYQIIDNTEYGIISMACDNHAYGIPMTIIRIGDSLYFHTGQKGKKIDFLKENSRVSISFVGKVQTPNPFNEEQIKELVKDPSNHGKFVNSVFTREFESVIVKGEVSLVEDEDIKVQVLSKISDKFTPDLTKYINIAIDRSISITKVFKVDIEDLNLRVKKVKV